jgi:hypothetical protein
MANKKISELTAVTSLAGTEPLPVVQAGETRKATVNQMRDLSAGFGPYYAGNDTPGAGLNVLASGYARIWHHAETGKTYLVVNIATVYKLVELTNYA